MNVGKHTIHELACFAHIMDSGVSNAPHQQLPLLAQPNTKELLETQKMRG